MSDDETKIFFGAGITVLLLILFFVLNPFHLIGAGEQAVVFNKFTNAISTRSSGTAFVTPIVNTFRKYSLRTTLTQYTNMEGLSSDSQTLRLNVDINWHLDAGKLTEIYRNIQGNIEDTIMYNAVVDTTKAELGKFKIDDIARNREFLRDGVKKALLARLMDKGIVIDNVSITNVDFNDDYEKAIEAKMIAQQKALEAANLKEKARQDAEAVRYASQTMTNLILRQKLIEKWDGHFPQIMTGSGSGILVQLTNTMGEQKE